MANEKIVQILIERGNELLTKAPTKIAFTGNSAADDLLNDLESFPHAFVLACVMDRQIKAERAWMIPYLISQEIGGFEFDRLFETEPNRIKTIFKKKSLHRFNEIMAENFCNAISMIHSRYDHDASLIWKGNPKSATIVRRFLEFKGVGVKISTMAANILVREFKIPVQDKLCIDISPDVQVKRVFTRLGFISKESSNDELIYCARELNPEYPGIFDLSAWEIGRNWCRPHKPDCGSCYLNEHCLKNL